MHLARRVDPTIPSRRLESLCEHFGISVKADHSACNDARATALLFQVLANRLCQGESWTLNALEIDVHAAVAVTLPQLPRRGEACPRSSALADMSSKRATYLGTLVAQLPAATDVTAEVDEYLAVLDRALEDRRITEDEAGALMTLAIEIGLVREQVRNAHEKYLMDLVRVALADGRLSESERHDIDLVREMLAVPVDRFDQLLKHESTRPSDPTGIAELEQPSTASLQGKTICFTGQMTCRINGDVPTRNYAESVAQKKGLVIKTSVAKSLDILVVADPDTMSNKACKARELGIRIIAEAVFWRMMGVKTD